MDALWTYRPEDFLLFSRQVYERQFALVNEAAWPWQAVLIALGLTIIAVQWRGRRAEIRLLGPALAALWISVAWVYFVRRHSQINWAAPAMAAAFALQGFSLTASCLIRSRPAFSGRGLTGTTIALFGLLAMPLLPLAEGRPLSQGQLVGLAPDPTAVFTLGVVAAASEPIRILTIIPLAWCLFSGIAMWTMEASFFWTASLLAILATTLAWFPARP